MTSTTTLPQGLYRSRPREVALSAGGRALATVAVLLVLAAPAVALLLRNTAENQHARRDALLNTGVVTNGVVTRLKRESKEDKRAMVYYRFSTDWETVEDREKIPFKLWNTLHVGTQLPIRYMPDNPSVNVPDGVVPRVLPLSLGYFVAPVFLIVAAVCGAGLRSQRRLLSEGRAAVAIVTSVKKHSGQHGSYHQIGFEFPLISGARQTGSTTVLKNPPAVGGSIIVVYDDENPRRSRLYPFSLVRLAE